MANRPVVLCLTTETLFYEVLYKRLMHINEMDILPSPCSTLQCTTLTLVNTAVLMPYEYH